MTVPKPDPTMMPPVEPAQATSEPVTDSAPPAAPDPVQETNWKAEARKWEARAKENSDAAARLKELEDAAKSEAEKQAEALARATEELALFKQREQVAAWAAEITKDSHVPASALRGSTEEELRSHFEELEKLITAPGETPEPTPRGSGAPYVGVEPQGTGVVPIGDQIAAAEKAGDYALAGRLKAIQLGEAMASR